MSSCSRIRGLACFGLTLLLSTAFPLPTSADDAGEAAAAAQQAPAPVRSIRRLGGATRFTPPVNDVATLRRRMSTARTQRDLGTVMERAGLPASARPDVLEALAEGLVTESTLAPGTTIEWMALRRGDTRPDVSRNLRWDGPRSLEGFTFVVDDLNDTYTFFVPKICGNLSLVSREPSREAARRAEDARKAEDARGAEAARQAAEAARRAEAARQAEEAARNAEAARQAEEARKAEQARRAEQAREAEEARKAEADRLAAEEAALRIRPFFAGYFGKQQRQYDGGDPAGLGTIRPDNWVPGFGNALVGLKGGVAVRMTPKVSLVPAIGAAVNLEEADRTSGFGDAEVAYAFARGMSLGAGITLWDFNHGDSFTAGWLGTAAFPLWRNDARQHTLDVNVEWRQFFDRMSDPDVNYQFWAGLRYMFK
ncbi:MAG: hypothetical protein A3I61_05615 [Acidobacteria bacterium RIFCSPLOWO2_02_FULL_68_18]|nr:MAG: hypothetical protein A3I61_05615 [Acidobacteria bacterium RIFCSPLOWO2_02_FULL_68_18]OFW48533.1 MAG: hypothetical protein A3G77_13730 [Acidobacteria bacterium RIFCSPLOWO2_12_FULL_68_19]